MRKKLFWLALSQTVSGSVFLLYLHPPLWFAAFVVLSVMTLCWCSWMNGDSS